MEDTREHKTTTGELTSRDRRRFMRALLTDLRAVERMLAEGMFEKGVSRIGCEQEMFLVDRSWNAAPAALEVLKRLDDRHYTTELGLFNLELNGDPQMFAGKGLAMMEAQIRALYERVKEVTAQIDLQPILAGILPTLAKTDLSIQNMVPNPRYLTLNRVMTAARGEGYDISIKGLDELVQKHDSLMFEACNASFQVHLQVAEPERFGHAYDISQLLLGPTLAIGTNSPTLFGKRLWAETRIALFEQSCDIRTPQVHARERSARVSFGKGWIRGSVLDIFKDNVTRYRPLVGVDPEEDALAVLARGEIPRLKALTLHNGTIYRWNRACYGISENGKPHLRIELRTLPSGPTILDEIANAAFWLGLMSELGATIEDLGARMDFDHAQANFYAAARDGLTARFTWLDSEEVIAQPFVLDRLLPLAEKGLARAGVDAADAKKYLGVIDTRVRSLRSGSRWVLRSLASMKDRGSPGEHAAALVAATIARQATGRPVAEWERARLQEIHGRAGYNRVAEYMQTDVLTVHADDPIELVADLMSWERVRHVPVEDEHGKLVGLVTSRAVLRHLADVVKQRADGKIDPGSTTDLEPERGQVASIMRREVITVTPDTLTIDAIAIMRHQRVACLPVVQDGHIVALLTEEDFMGIAAELLDERFGQVDPPHERPKSREASLKVERTLGRLGSHTPGVPAPTLIAVAAIHGNEHAGIHAARRVLARLEELAAPLNGELLFLAGNVGAIAENRRFRARDLNRVWTDGGIAEALEPSGPVDPEHTEVRELLGVINDAVERTKGPVFLVDLHTTSAAGVPFALLGATPGQRIFARAFPLPLIMGLEDQLEGVLSLYWARRGCTTIAVEGGQHDDPATIDNLTSALWVAAAAAGVIDGDSLPEVLAARRLLEARRADLPRLTEVVSRHAITPEDAFRMEPGFRNLDYARPDQLLARDRTGEIRAPREGVVVLPLYQKDGNDGFFWGRVVDADRVLSK